MTESRVTPEPPDQLEQLEQRSRLLGQLRFLAFLIVLAATIASIFLPALLVAVVAPVALGLFPVLIVLHHRVDRRGMQYRTDAILAAEHLDRSSGRSVLATPPVFTYDDTPLFRGELPLLGEAELHALDDLTCEDLGLIDGKRSVFGLIDTSSTFFGAARLRWLLSHPLVGADRICERQSAVRELSENDIARRRLLSSLVTLRGQGLERLAGALDSTFDFADARGVERAVRLLGALLPMLIIIACFWTGAVAFILPLVLLHFGIVALNSSRSNPARDRLRLLGPVSRALLLLDRELHEIKLESHEWLETRQDLASTREVTRALIRKIRNLEWHDFGIVFELFNVITLWELRTLPSAERLVRENRDAIRQALGALGHAEALLSLSCLAAERSDFNWPRIEESESPVLEAKEIAHPLLDHDTRVANPLALGTESSRSASTVVVTGSNMAGKSTYLKTVGVNTVLAAIGSPICGKEFHMTPLSLFTDVNIRDSLDDGKSYFQVEVERVQQAIDATERSPFVLAIFDELFRGTNARERFAISQSLVEHVTDRGALLLIATHDDRLASLVEDAAGHEYRNVHFREHVDGSELQFDYTLRDGPATTRNAIRVLEVSGYPPTIIHTAREIVDRER